MIIDIDETLLGPRILTRIRELVDLLDKPGVEISQTSKGIRISKVHSEAVKYVIVARSHYRARSYIHNRGYKMDECAITLCDNNGHYVSPKVDAVTVEFADYYVA